MSVIFRVADLDLDNDEVGMDVDCLCADHGEEGDDGSARPPCPHCGGSGTLRALVHGLERSVSNESFLIVATVCGFKRFGHCCDLSLPDAPHGRLAEREILLAERELLRFLNVAHARARFVRPSVELGADEPASRARVIDLSTGEDVSLPVEVAKCYSFGMSDERLVRLADDLLRLFSAAKRMGKAVEFA